MQTATCCSRAHAPEASFSGRRLEARPGSQLRLPARHTGRAGRLQLRSQALLMELDLPAAVAGLQDVLPPLHAASASAAASATHLHASGAAAALHGDQLQQLLTLGDAAAQRIADLADAAAAAAGDAGAAAGAAKKDNGWLQPLVTGLETVLTFIEDGLVRVGVPYSYGWSIVALTALIKLATFPLTKKQARPGPGPPAPFRPCLPPRVESALNVQRLKPQIDAIKEQYGDNKDAVQRETSALYEKAGVDPLAGCLPSLATIPIFIGLYRSLSDFSTQQEAGSAAFYWIPSLAGPTSVAAQKAGSGTAWLLPLVDGVPPIGWDLASRYLALPVALYISNAIITPPQTDDSGAAKFTQNLVKVLPLMIGWFALNVPAGLSLYYFSNTVFTTAQQVYLKKLGGANLAEYDLGPIELGKARRTGTVAASMDEAAAGEGAAEAAALADQNGAAGNGGGAAAAGEEGDAGQLALAAAAAAPAVPQISRRCKRRRRELLESAA
ncbi:hypothetical protein CHLNCDRAFT_136603 [Chlorella variabilis]|uniref:Membrane insertase YidC/Oxa/ALB C-terminal domain-containing protein n=1 Tax=Chlorella variabilis TaxID=554065 RepID=E1ZKN7_CHLVA|nr:hypothetical protein CHLNCDRAFT_136603 [Chlorella variabilis]EFN53413.1 hypothetical protein CHLNCDRAFT_136603 [Chlorella variabilis]|eukprot:XP_005845515.1 hypothetical protein CHLNCDRAFT_136603 [Chlorella variabilis]